MVVLLIVLAVVIGSLWQQIRGLRDRIEMLERAKVNGTVVNASPWSQPAASLQEVAEQDLATALPPEPEPDPVATLIAGQEPWATVTHEQPAAEADLLPEGVRRVGGAGFEDIFGRRLPIWAGGVTLAIAGFLIVKYSIQAGLLSPLVRVVLGLLFGGGLIGGAEAALRRKVPRTAYQPVHLV